METGKQYATDENLQRRIRVKKLFSTGKGWADFLLQHFQLRPGQRVLELGCGNAIFWSAVATKVPAGVKLVLSDFSAGMLDAAKSNTKNLKFIEDYAAIDAQHIPFDDNTFDVVTANYMLYHVPDVQQAIREISRVLKPSGLLCAATFGKGNLKEVHDIFQGFDERIDHVIDDLTEVFGLENGGLLLKKCFDCVQLKHFESGLHITELEPLTDYFLSYWGMGNVEEIITPDRMDEFKRYIAEVFAAKGYVDITQEEGLFIASMPRK